jgi:hypothetical protein
MAISEPQEPSQIETADPDDDVLLVGVQSYQLPKRSILVSSNVLSLVSKGFEVMFWASLEMDRS